MGVDPRTASAYLEAVRALADYYAPASPAAAVVARRAPHVTSLDQHRAFVAPALDEYREQLPAALRELLADPPKETVPA